MSTIIGLTGQSGAGKTMICQHLIEAGFGVINCDEIARSCTIDGSECNKELAKVFPACFDKKLSLDRMAISKMIFSDKQMLKRFDDIIYPYINRLIDKRISELSRKHDFIVLDAPTLFEAGADKKCDIIIGVIADKTIRLKRIVKRDGISEELALKRFSSQHTTRFYKNRCDFIIENNASLSEVKSKSQEIITIIKERINGSSKK